MQYYIFKVLIVDCGGCEVCDGVDMTTVGVCARARVALVIKHHPKQHNGASVNPDSDTVRAQSCHSCRNMILVLTNRSNFLCTSLLDKNSTTFCLSSRHQLVVDSDAVVMEVVIVDQD